MEIYYFDYLVSTLSYVFMHRQCLNYTRVTIYIITVQSVISLII